MCHFRQPSSSTHFQSQCWEMTVRAHPEFMCAVLFQNPPGGREGHSAPSGRKTHLRAHLSYQCESRAGLQVIQIVACPSPSLSLGLAKTPHWMAQISKQTSTPWKPNFSWSEARRRTSETGKAQLPNVEMKSWSSQFGGSKKGGGKLLYRFSSVKRNEHQVRKFFSFSMGC